MIFALLIQLIRKQNINHLKKNGTTSEKLNVPQLSFKKGEHQDFFYEFKARKI